VSDLTAACQPWPRTLLASVTSRPIYMYLTTLRPWTFLLQKPMSYDAKAHTPAVHRFNSHLIPRLWLRAEQLCTHSVQSYAETSKNTMSSERFTVEKRNKMSIILLNKRNTEHSKKGKNVDLYSASHVYTPLTRCRY